ncbi:hypothetical protein J6590_077833 [Homalodisca vitripennis]|nr:hypothetical protein J6590_077833 [Homalodisca vitripennis]
MPACDTVYIVKAECENSHVGIRNGGGRMVCFITSLALSLIEQRSRLLAALASHGRDAVVIQFSTCCPRLSRLLIFLLSVKTLGIPHPVKIAADLFTQDVERRTPKSRTCTSIDNSFAANLVSRRSADSEAPAEL